MTPDVHLLQEGWTYLYRLPDKAATWSTGEEGKRYPHPRQNAGDMHHFHQGEIQYETGR